MTAGQEFYFICDKKMGEKIGRVVILNDGEILSRDIRSDGVVISIRKNES